MRVIVTGLVATYPVGGVAWDYLQYVQAFHALGCDVHYLEDTGQWVYDPAAQTFTDDVSANARYLAAALASLDPGLERRWTVRGPDGRLHGLDERELAALCAQTDLFLNVSGSCWLREPYRAARVKAYVDTDPCYSQARIAAVDASVADESTRFSVDLMRRHDVFFTNGEHVGAPDCLVPTCGLRWHPTRQPIVLASWPVRAAPDGPFTTVMSWKIEPTPPSIGGTVYGGKDVEFERFMDIPSRTPEVLEVAILPASGQSQTVVVERQSALVIACPDGILRGLAKKLEVFTAIAHRFCNSTDFKVSAPEIKPFCLPDPQALSLRAAPEAS